MRKRESFPCATVICSGPQQRRRFAWRLHQNLAMALVKLPWRLLGKVCPVLDSDRVKSFEELVSEHANKCHKQGQPRVANLGRILTVIFLIIDEG
jgi:hypothetical protein